MPDIPPAVTVIVRHPRRRRRVIIAIHAFDDPLRIAQTDDTAGHVEELLQLIAHQISVRPALPIGKWLVDVTDKDVAGMRPNQSFHLFRLTDRLRKALLRRTQPKSGKSVWVIRPKPIAIFVHLALDRTLGQAQKVYMAEFGQQDIINELRPILAKHAPLLVAHGIGSRAIGSPCR